MSLTIVRDPQARCTLTQHYTYELEWRPAQHYVAGTQIELRSGSRSPWARRSVAPISICGRCNGMAGSSTPARCLCRWSDPQKRGPRERPLGPRRWGYPSYCKRTWPIKPHGCTT
jgi:hypothetical protein